MPISREKEKEKGPFPVEIWISRQTGFQGDAEASLKCSDGLPHFLRRNEADRIPIGAA
jgi:hypothetical protein